MDVPLDIYQHISDICPEIMLHLAVKGIKGPSQFAIAKYMLQGKNIKWPTLPIEIREKLQKMITQTKANG